MPGRTHTCHPYRSRGWAGINTEDSRTLLNTGRASTTCFNAVLVVLYEETDLLTSHDCSTSLAPCQDAP